MLPLKPEPAWKTKPGREVHQVGASVNLRDETTQAVEV